MLLHPRLILRLRLMLLHPRLILRLRLILRPHLRLSLRPRLGLSRSGSRCKQDPELVMTVRPAQTANSARMPIAGPVGRTVPAFR
jgi:hypothetical protein